MKKNLGVKNWMFPMPVLMIGTYCADGTPDVMNAKAVSSDRVATCDLLHATQITARGG